MNSQYATWNLHAQNALNGRTVKSVSYMTREQADRLDFDYWRSLPLVMEFTDGTIITFAKDDECNDGGSVVFLTENDVGLLPTLSG